MKWQRSYKRYLKTGSSRNMSKKSYRSRRRRKKKH